MSSPAPAVVWITGRPASGKTTLARSLVAALRRQDMPVLWLDSDDLRAVMTPAAAYDDSERDAFYATLGHLARLSADGGVNVVISATASRSAYRDAARAAVPVFFEIFLRCDTGELRRRDPRGLYRKANSGEVKNLPGIDAAYEAPDSAELVLDSGDLEPEAMLQRTCDALNAKLGWSLR